MGNGAENLAVRRGVSAAADEGQVAAELASQAAASGAAVALAFVSPHFDCDVLAPALAEAFAPTPVFGCTTAGEIGPGGFLQRSAVALTLEVEGLRVAAGFEPAIAGSGLSAGRRATLRAIEELGVAPEALRARRHVAVTLVDGWSGEEESFIAAASATAPGIKFVGGSASDDLSGERRARVLHGGRAEAGGGLVLIFETDAPFTALMSEHMVPSDQRVVVTASDPSSRVVHELNGVPARRAYAALLQLPADELDSTLAARFPFGYYVGGRAYVRSVMGVSGDSLRFACAVDEGTVLRLMRAGDMLASTKQALDEAAAEVGGDVAAMIVFHCLGRYLEAEQTGATGDLGALLDRMPVIGFNTFGEQFNALHVNHTLTALAFGRGLDV